MKTFTTALVASFAALAQAVSLTNSDFSVKAGQPFTITWTDAQGPVTLTLKNGPSDDLKTVSPITSGATGTSFSWTPSASLPSDTYAIEISDGTDVNYSTQFPVVGASGTPAATSASGSITATASDSASASASASVTLTITSSASETASETAATVSSAANSTTASTMASTVSTRTRVSASISGSTTAPTTVPGSDAGRIGSPIALIGLAVAAMLYIQ